VFENFSAIVQRYLRRQTHHDRTQERGRNQPKNAFVRVLNGAESTQSAPSACSDRAQPEHSSLFKPTGTQARGRPMVLSVAFVFHDYGPKSRPAILISTYASPRRKIIDQKQMPRTRFLVDLNRTGRSTGTAQPSCLMLGVQKRRRSRHCVCGHTCCVSAIYPVFSVYNVDVSL
jgi:hypothetical protein